jgi:hypothetical protein
MAVTADKYELPCAVTESAPVLASMYDIDISSFYRLTKIRKPYKKKKVKFVKVEV